MKIKKNFILYLSMFFLCFLLTGLVPLSSAFDLGGFLEELDGGKKKQPTKKEKRWPGRQSPKAKPGGLLGLGEVLGIDKKTLDIISKGAKTIQALQPVKYEEEKTLGGAIAVQVFNRFGGSYNDKSLLQYVNLIGNTLAMFSDRPNIPYHFAILNDPQPNAFAVPGGFVFVTIGLLRKIKNEAELAGVLAHEIAHISQKHTLKTLRRSKFLKGISELTLTAMDKNPEMFENVINNISKTLFEKGLDQNLEYEADKIGTEFAYRAGYNPRGLSDFLLTLKKIQGKEKSIFFKTHPSPSRRLNKLASTVLPNYQGTAKYPKLSLRFKLTAKGIL